MTGCPKYGLASPKLVGTGILGLHKKGDDMTQKATPVDWGPWNEERAAFTSRDTQGFSKDLAALEAHIKKLQSICPKDKAGWPVGLALYHISKLTKQYNSIRNYLQSLNP